MHKEHHIYYIHPAEQPSIPLHFGISRDPAETVENHRQAIQFPSTPLMRFLAEHPDFEWKIVETFANEKEARAALARRTRDLKGRTFNTTDTPSFLTGPKVRELQREALRTGADDVEPVPYIFRQGDKLMGFDGIGQKVWEFQICT